MKSNLCDYTNAYIFVKRDITVTAAPQTQASSKNCAVFIEWVTKSDERTIDDAEDLDLVIYNLIEYSSNYSETRGSLQFYSKDEATDFNNNIANTDDLKSFNYKTKLLENTVAQFAPNAADGILRNATFAVPLKYLSNFLR